MQQTNARLLMTFCIFPDGFRILWLFQVSSFPQKWQPQVHKLPVVMLPKLNKSWTGAKSNYFKTSGPTNCGSLTRSPTTNWYCLILLTLSWNLSSVQPCRHDWSTSSCTVNVGHLSPWHRTFRINFLFDPDNAFVAGVTCQHRSVFSSSVINLYSNCHYHCI